MQLDAHADMTPNQEITIPKSGTEVIFELVISLIVVVFTILAIVDLFILPTVDIFIGVALIAPCIWLALVTMFVWSESRKAGGLCRFLANWLGDLFGRHFAEIPALDSPSQEIQFGYELLGRRFVKQAIGIGTIETVEWRPGQATDMAGRDMNDWQVCLWYDHCDPVKSETRRRLYRKPDQDLYLVGPSSHKKKIEAFGMNLVAFLRAAGAPLVQSDKSNCFVRANSNEW